MVAPLIAAALTPFVKDLFANGLSLLGNAIMSKGKEKVEEKLGIKLPPEGTALSPEKLIELRSLEFQHEEALMQMAIRKEEIALEGDKVASEAVSKRWEADMLSDSWLSKNIRPLALIHTFLALDVLLLCALFGVAVGEGYLSLLKELLMLMVGAYFVGRTVEKAVDVHQGWKQTGGN